MAGDGRHGHPCCLYGPCPWHVGGEPPRLAAPPSPSAIPTGAAVEAPAVPSWRAPDDLTPYTSTLSRLYGLLFASGAAAATAAAGYRDAAVLAAAIAARLGLDRLGRLRAATAAPVRDVQARCRQRRGWAARGGGGGGGCPAGGVC